MKRLVFIVLFLTIGWTSAHAFLDPRLYSIVQKPQLAVAAAGGPEAASCQATPFYDSFGTSTGYATGDVYAGTQTFNPGASKSICAIHVKMTCVYNTCAGQNYTLYIMTLTGDNLNYASPVGTSSAVSGVDGWSGTEVTFLFPANPAVTNGTNYAVVVSPASGDPAVRINGADGTGTDGVWDAGGVRTDYNTEITEIKAYAYE